MRQINCNLGGAISAAPILTLDERRPDGSTITFTMVVESPTRGYFQIHDDTLKPWGASVAYGPQFARLSLPPDPGSFEAALPPVSMDPQALIFGSAMPSIQIRPDGFFLPNGWRWNWAMMTGFSDYAAFLDGQDIRPLLAQAEDLGSRGRRIFGMMANLRRFVPQDYGDAFYGRLPEFASLLAEYGQYLDFSVFADAQIVMKDQGQQSEHWARCCDVLRTIPTAFTDLGNEWPKNGFNPDRFAFAGYPCSQGSTTSDAAPPMPGWGIRKWHGRRDYPKVWLSNDDMLFVQMGIEESGHAYAPPAATVVDEPIGFAEVDIPGRRSTDPRLAESLAHSALAYGHGATYHCEDGMYARLLGPTQQTCALSFFRVLNA